MFTVVFVFLFFYFFFAFRSDSLSVYFPLLLHNSHMKKNNKNNRAKSVVNCSQRVTKQTVSENHKHTHAFVCLCGGRVESSEVMIARTQAEGWITLGEMLGLKEFKSEYSGCSHWRDCPWILIERCNCSRTLKGERRRIRIRN